MAKERIENNFKNVVITGYAIETSKDRKYTFEKLVMCMVKRDGSFTKEFKVNITTGTQTCLKGLQKPLEAVLGLPLAQWDSLAGKKLNIEAKILMLNSKKDPNGFPEFVTGTKATILKREAEETIFTNEEIEAMRPEGKEKAKPLSSEALVINTGDEF